MGECFIARRGGGGVNGATVVNAESDAYLPATAKVGTICIISGIKPNKVYVSVDEPSTPVAGDLWILPDNDGMFYYQIGHVCVMFNTAFQYNGSEWVKCSVYQLTENGWKEPAMYLYYKGDLCADVTGGWNRYSSYSAVVEFNDDHIYMDEGNNGYHNSAIQTVELIPFSGFSKLKCQCVNSGGQVRNQFYLRIYSSQGNGYMYSNEAWTDGTVVAEQSSSALETVELSLDISGYNDETYYVGIKSDTVLEVNAIWLEA